MTTYPMDLETPAGRPLSTTKGSPDARVGASGNVGSIPESLVSLLTTIQSCSGSNSPFLMITK
jgi:hypothetical protein